MIRVSDRHNPAVMYTSQHRDDELIKFGITPGGGLANGILLGSKDIVGSEDIVVDMICRRRSRLGSVRYSAQSRLYDFVVSSRLRKET